MTEGAGAVEGVGRGTNLAPDSPAPASCSQPWFWSAWFTGAMLAMAGVILLTALVTSASWQFTASELTLLGSVYASLFLLSGHRLLSPLHTGVLVFFWWFGVGPLVISTHTALVGDRAGARVVQAVGQETLLVVALGLPLYAAAAAAVLRWLEAHQLYARFLKPDGRLFSPVTTLYYCAAGFLAVAGLRGLEAVGIQGITTINYLGATRTEFWGAGVLVATAQMTSLGAAALLTHVAVRRLQTPWWLMAVGAAIVADGLYRALTSGWKGPFVVLFAMLLSASVSARQRPPWLLVLSILVGYLAVVEPFVATARYLAEQARAQTVEDRERVFSEYLAGGGLSVRSDWRSWQVSSPFRAMYPAAGETMKESAAFSGPWRGRTLLWAVQANVPRAMWAAKPELGTGNFFSRTVGAAAGLSNPSDAFNSVTIGLPFEFVGNFGWFAGILAFGLLGAFWAAWCGWLLSAERISDHPLTPFFVMAALNFEMPLEAFLVRERDLVVVLVCAYVIWILRRRRL